MSGNLAAIHRLMADSLRLSHSLNRFSPLLLRERFFMLIEAVSNPIQSTFPIRFKQALADMRQGRPVLLMDDFDRENEADLIVAAEKITDRSMAQMIRDGSGIVCLCLPDETLQHLQLPPMVADNQSRFSTAFTVSIEARHGVSTGVSAADRVTTIKAAIAQGAQPEDLASPGHVFPLRATAGGVLARRGHTEGSVDLAVLAGLQAAAVLCELMNPDGTMARGGDITRYAAENGLQVLSIAELVEYRLQQAK
jgi:3,4-dihydroxy 2-butanone 4-phosphate synthase